MNSKNLATKIVRHLQQATMPGHCTWGDANPDAHAQLFAGYYEDMVASITRVIEQEKRQKRLRRVP